MFHNRVMRQRRWFLRLTILTIVLALTIGTSLMYALQISTVAVVQSNIDSYKPFLTGLRFVIIALIAYAWPRLVQYAQHSGRVSKQRGTELLSLHWRLTGWLLGIELVLGQNLVGRFLTAMDWLAI
jgi:hypothetical protein